MLLHELQIFALGRALPDEPRICPPANFPESFRAKTAGLDASGPKPGNELRLGQFFLSRTYSCTIE